MKMDFGKIILLLFLLSACEFPKNKAGREAKELSTVKGFDHDHFYIVKIDGCEYVVYHGSQKGGIIHKANCKNHLR